METHHSHAAAAAHHALRALGYLGTFIWILAAATELVQTHAKPIYLHLVTALWAMFPIFVAGTLHMAVVKDDLFHALARPIHNEWFGRSKTWRGVLAMAAFSIVGVYSLEALFGSALSRGTFDFHRLSPVGLGLGLGVTFILAELPNSYLKRRVGIAPGARAPRFPLIFVLGDQLDSVIACGLLYVLVLGMPWTTFIVLLPVGVLSLLLLKRILFHLGMREAPT